MVWCKCIWTNVMGRNAYFQFKRFRVNFNRDVFPVGTDACLLAAWFCYNLKKNKVNTCLDVGCGSGILSVFAAKELNASCTAIDINTEAIEQCRENFRINNIENLLECYNANFVEPIFSSYKKFDLIVCNPPYFTSLKKAESKKELARQSAEHFSIKSLFKQSASLLSVNAALCLVIPFDLLDTYMLNAKANNLHLWHKAFVRGTEETKIKRVLLHFKNIAAPYLKVEQITIETSRGIYSDKAYALLRPFYLYL